MAAIPIFRTDQPKMAPLQPVALQPAAPVIFSDTFPNDAVFAWYRGEFAAANAIIDALCAHIGQLSPSSNDYDSVFAAIHRRRFNWIPVIQMQKYHSIADVTIELGRVAEKRTEFSEGGRKIVESDGFAEKRKMEEELVKNVGNGRDNGTVEAPEEYDSPDSEITDSGSQEMHQSFMSNNICSNLGQKNICSNHEGCSSQMKLTKGFKAKESVKGHMVNVVKGLKLFEDIFAESEISKLNDFVNDIHAAGQKGELSGNSYILFNKQVKGNKRELIQLGVPIFEQIKDDAKSNIEPIPPTLYRLIDQLIQWKLIPEYKRPNACIINFFEEGEFSQPFLKPPHVDQPLSTLVLSESTMAFGRFLTSENDGNYKGSLMLSLKKGSLLVMRGNSADMARHVMCSSPNKRVSINFFRVRPDSHQGQPPTSSMTTATTLWQPGAIPFALPNGTLSGYEGMDMMPKWGSFDAPMVMLTPMCPMAMNPGKLRGGTGVFLPWKGQTRKQTRHVPQHAQNGRLMELPSPIESNMGETASESSIRVKG